MALSEKSWQSGTKTTLTLLMFLMAVLIAAVAGLVWIIAGRAIFWYRLIGLMLITGLALFSAVTLSGIVAFYLLWYNKQVPNRLLSMVNLYLQWLYPVLLAMGKSFGKDINEIRRAYTRLNNQSILGRKKRYQPSEVLILVPHCIQQADCSVKLTNEIMLCRECGLCDISDLIALKNKYRVDTAVVTGGTLARKRISDKRPKLIIAIACERDLISGLMDVRKIPVYAMINERPEGPCHNTHINAREVEKILNRLLER
jgi:uncharacterized protein